MLARLLLSFASNHAMKICPDCALANEERFPACIVCHASLADVGSTPAADPEHPEHAQRKLTRQRHRIARRQFGWAAVCYVLVITGLAVCPGMVFTPDVQALYALSGLVVVLAVLQNLAGTFVAGSLQGAASLTIFLCFGPQQPFAFFMLAGHVLMPMMFCQWVEMIHDATR